MLPKFFSSGQGGGAAPVNYLIAESVLAYDENRNVIRDGDGRPCFKHRDPLPVIIAGDPALTRMLIDSSANKWSYSAGVIAFADNDNPSEEQQLDVMEAFERLAFAGLDPEQYNILWVRHVHDGNVELHFCIPRLELSTGKSYNPAPPGYEKAFNSLCDHMNKKHSWADPKDPARIAERKITIESQDRADSRETIQNLLEKKAEEGEVNNRSEMIEAIKQLGLEVPRAGKNYITVKDPETQSRWRMKGEIYNENWTRQTTVERAYVASRQAETNPQRRLDGICIEELEARYRTHIERRERYNRERYPRPSVYLGLGSGRRADQDTGEDSGAVGSVNHPSEAASAQSESQLGLAEESHELNTSSGEAKREHQTLGDGHGSDRGIYDFAGHLDECSNPKGNADCRSDIDFDGGNARSGENQNAPPTDSNELAKPHDIYMQSKPAEYFVWLQDSGVLTNDQLQSNRPSGTIVDTIGARAPECRKRIEFSREQLHRRTERLKSRYHRLAGETAQGARSLIERFRDLSASIQQGIDWLGRTTRRQASEGRVGTGNHASGTAEKSRFIRNVLKSFFATKHQQASQAPVDRPLKSNADNKPTALAATEHTDNKNTSWPPQGGHMAEDDRALFDQAIDLEKGEIFEMPEPSRRSLDHPSSANSMAKPSKPASKKNLGQMPRSNRSRGQRAPQPPLANSIEEKARKEIGPERTPLERKKRTRKTRNDDLER